MEVPGGPRLGWLLSGNCCRLAEIFWTDRQRELGDKLSRSLERSKGTGPTAMIGQRQLWRTYYWCGSVSVVDGVRSGGQGVLDRSWDMLDWVEGSMSMMVVVIATCAMSITTCCIVCTTWFASRVVSEVAITT